MASAIRFGLPATKGGVPHLAPTSVRRVCPAAECVLTVSGFDAHDAATALQAAGAVGLAQFVGLQEYEICVLPRQPLIGMHASAQTSATAIAGDITTGRIQLTVAQFAKGCNACGATIVAALHDATPVDQAVNHKRTVSENRSKEWIAGTIVGLPQTTTAVATPLRAVPPIPDEQYAVEYEAGGGVAALAVGLGETPDMLREYISRSVSEATVRSARIIVTHAPSIRAFVEEVNLIAESGIRGIVSAGFPIQLAHKGVALQHSIAVDGSSQLGTINFWDHAYAECREPLQVGCGCQPCSRHTKGYMHHLLKVHEMNSDILIIEHNLHVVMQVIRTSINRHRQS